MTILNLSERIPVSHRFPGAYRDVGAARRFLADLLGRNHPCFYDAALLTSELATVIMYHAQICVFGRDTPEFTVSVRAEPDSVGVTVLSPGCGCWAVPGVTLGRGLHLVELIAARSGLVRTLPDPGVWFELRDR
ncbi:ATP-binding protein [Rhizohabitans arisaemae]|uniref:ATP-binding protein n=1 Tax=Rhizohabitans arisaemae TaxID=2720610 RepID=UPI0024B043F4|nr:ATP-binding protein [Rhizohabitans arisaemae]